MTMLEGESPNRRTATVWTFIITDGIFFVNRYFCFYTPFLSKTRRLPNQETADSVFPRHVIPSERIDNYWGDQRCLFVSVR